MAINWSAVGLKVEMGLTFQEAKAVQMKILSTFEDGYIFEYNLVGDRTNVQRGRVTRKME